MAKGARELVRSLYEDGRLDGIVGLGGSGGTSMITEAMQVLPIGVPKVMVSTLACGDTRSFVAGRDIVMMYPVVDIAGLNSISVQVINNAAGAIVGMVTAETVSAPNEGKGRGIVGATQFGVTTACVDVARKLLESEGFEVLPFHATGTGGQSLEALANDGAVDAVLDITTTELADELLGGIHSAGPNRLEAAGANGVPQVVSLGALDMCDFGPFQTVPEKYQSRNLYKHNSNVTLMRTTAEENAILGRQIAEKLNRAKGPVHLFVPLLGVSMIDAPDKPFYDRDADAALFKAIRETVDVSVVELTEIDAHINDPEFGTAMAERIISLIGDK
jgi:uncharacterized protein (UPF0261 family)